QMTYLTEILILSQNFPAQPHCLLSFTLKLQNPRLCKQFFKTKPIRTKTAHRSFFHFPEILHGCIYLPIIIIHHENMIVNILLLSLYAKIIPDGTVNFLYFLFCETSHLYGIFRFSHSTVYFNKTNIWLFQIISARIHITPVGFL